MSETQNDYDSPWKEALKRFFPDFMALFFQEAYADIDWARGHEFLDKELQQVTPEAASGRRQVDTLTKIWRKGGDEVWVLVHVEVQSQVEAGFAERMYVYNYRLYDRYRRQVASLAVLADEQPSWRPQRFGYELWGCRAELIFPNVKLWDYRQRWSELESSRNPFATVAMAHLKAQETRHDPHVRQRWKIWLARRLYETGHTRQEIISLFRLIDWLLQLPEPLEDNFWQEIRSYEEQIKMDYITSVERRAIKQGIEQGIERGMQREALRQLMRVLRYRFGDAALPMLEEPLQGLSVADLESLMDVALDASSVEVFLHKVPNSE